MTFLSSGYWTLVKPGWFVDGDSGLVEVVWREVAGGCVRLYLLGYSCQAILGVCVGVGLNIRLT